MVPTPKGSVPQLRIHATFSSRTLGSHYQMCVFSFCPLSHIYKRWGNKLYALDDDVLLPANDSMRRSFVFVCRGIAKRCDERVRGRTVPVKGEILQNFSANRPGALRRYSPPLSLSHTLKLSRQTNTNLPLMCNSYQQNYLPDL